MSELRSLQHDSISLRPISAARIECSEKLLKTTLFRRSHPCLWRVVLPSPRSNRYGYIRDEIGIREVHVCICDDHVHDSARKTGSKITRETGQDPPEAYIIESTLKLCRCARVFHFLVVIAHQVSRTFFSIPRHPRRRSP